MPQVHRYHTCNINHIDSFLSRGQYHFFDKKVFSRSILDLIHWSRWMIFWTTLTVKKSPYKSTGYKVVKVVKVENLFLLNPIKCILMRIKH